MQSKETIEQKKYRRTFGVDGSTTIEKSLKVSIYLLVLWSFTAGAMTQVFSPLFSLIYYGLIFVSWFVSFSHFRRRGWFWHPLTILILFITFLGLYRDPVQSLFFLLNYLMINRLFNLRKTRDFAQLIIISFFQVLFASVLTSSMTFAVLLGGYIILFLLALILLNCQRDYLSAKKLIVDHFMYDTFYFEHNLSRHYQKFLTFLRPLFSSIMLYWLVILFLMVNFFLILPRLSQEQFVRGFFRLDANRRSGFSDDMSFDAESSITLDPTIVMRVKVLPPDDNTKAPRVDHLRIRGTALDYFDGLTWQVSAPFDLSTFAARAIRDASLKLETISGGTRVVQEVILEPNRTNYLFGIDTPFSFHFISHPESVVVNQDLLSCRFIRKPAAATTYQVHSYIKPSAEQILPDQNKLREDIPDDELSKIYRRINLNVPDDRYSDEILELAQNITQQSSSELESAFNIERYLRQNYEYSLEATGKRSASPIGQFLFETQKGHCELYSSAMCFLLRAIQIPARIVVGYYSNEWNDYGEYFVVRESNAHAWVEAWISGFGWLTFDPTPPQSLPITQNVLTISSRLSHMLDSVRVKWYRYVIDFDLEDQRRLNLILGRRAARAIDIADSIVENFFGLLNPRPSSNIRFAALILMIIFLLAAFVVAFTTFFTLKKEGSRLRIISKKRHESIARKRNIITFLYMKILDHLRKSGYMKRKGQTPMEFAAAIAAADSALGDFVSFTNIYYHIRFGDYVLSDDDRGVIARLFSALDIPPPRI